MAEHNQTGIKGEIIAQKYLRRHGYIILETNWRFQRAEIDIIAKRDDMLIFVEVKTRSSERYGSPEQFVSDKKIDFVLEAASQYMYSIGYESEVRFDVVAIIINGLKGFKLTHYKDAFYRSW